MAEISENSNRGSSSGMIRSIAAIGSTCDPSTWSGIPYFFWQAAKSVGFADAPWEMDLSQVRWQRYLWNLLHLKDGIGGFQYSAWFLDLLERQIEKSLKASEIITFNQHFPRISTISRAGGSLNHYLDAPFSAFAGGKALTLKLPRAVIERAVRLEKENLYGSRRIITMARWAADAISEDHGIQRSAIHTILPGANLMLPEGWTFPEFDSEAGIDRDFVFGFIGKDWNRKGLPWLLELCDELHRRNLRVSVMAAGNAPPELLRRDRLTFAGFIDKRHDGSRFLDFLTRCDVGCLFSSQEALGISTLEFLRAGVPVAGFEHEGMSDTLPVDAGFRFSPATAVSHAADVFEGYIKNTDAQALLRANARRWSGLLTWERCVMEFQELWATGDIRNPVRPWLGLP